MPQLGYEPVQLERRLHSLAHVALKLGPKFEVLLLEYQCVVAEVALLSFPPLDPGLQGRYLRVQVRPFLEPFGQEHFVLWQQDCHQALFDDVMHTLSYRLSPSHASRLLSVCLRCEGPVCGSLEQRLFGHPHL